MPTGDALHPTNTILCLCDYMIAHLGKKMNNTLCKNRCPNFTICAKKAPCLYDTALMYIYLLIPHAFLSGFTEMIMQAITTVMIVSGSINVAL